MKSVFRGLFLMSLVLIFFGVLGFGSKSFSQDRLDIPLEELQKIVLDENYTFHSRGKIFGYVSTESCLYIGKKVAILRHYCFPVKNYPAKNFTIIHKDLGIWEFYQEDLGKTQRRRVTLDTFPEDLKLYFDGKVEELTITNTSQLIETMYYDYLPACWSANNSPYQDGEVTDCYETDIYNYPFWSKTTLNLALQKMDWDAWIEKLSVLTEGTRYKFLYIPRILFGNRAVERTPASN
jgi:hypothetical protein